MVNLEWYRSFIAVYRVGTVSGAAEVLHLTQPAVSQHVAALESTLGTPLFQRMPRRMLPTESGKRLYTRVVTAIETLEAIPTKTASADAPLLIRLGTPMEFFSEYVLSRLPKQNETLFAIQFGLVQDLIEHLLANRIDCAIATQKVPKPELEYQLLFEENFWLVGPPGMTIPLSQDVMQADLMALEQWLRTQFWIAYSEELPIIRRFWRVIFDRRLDVNPQLVIPDLRSIRGAIAQGLGCSVLPDYLCADWIDNQQLTLILKPVKAVTNSIWLAYRKSERQSQQVTLFLDLMGVQR
ncbi:LysR family transcriptional regulator [Leptolyngbya sp. FACHB-541]|uniref:LysR family transcriptional regulator n=1 Tax=Leptolyngbya sp. FACHB-541 TaxID=2692810 RepID=UPI00168294C8|nr:LysR family transcriptional regulator [Leptolyngbya sp. FACHB-541]MBD2000539.1 LysR family transcriptional regulator [Leptolyngbya sp. FACHB-541]